MTDESVSTETEEEIRKKRKKVSEGIDRIRESGVFSGGKTGTEIIREFRDKRK